MPRQLVSKAKAKSMGNPNASVIYVKHGKFVNPNNQCGEFEDTSFFDAMENKGLASKPRFDVVAGKTSWQRIDELCDKQKR